MITGSCRAKNIYCLGHVTILGPLRWEIKRSPAVQPEELDRIERAKSRRNAYKRSPERHLAIPIVRPSLLGELVNIMISPLLKFHARQPTRGP